MNVETAQRVIKKISWAITKEERFLNLVSRAMNMPPKERERILKDALWVDGTIPSQVQYSIRKREKLVNARDRLTKRYCSNAVNHNGIDFHSSKVGIYSNEKINAYESRNSERVTFIDLFAGIGGFHQSLHSLGAKCVFASEIDKNARITYEHNYKDVSPNLFENDYKLFNSDITKQNLSEIPDFDILCAGFPCQPFSIAGKRKGFEDTRGTLFFNIASIVKEKVQNAKAPKVLFLENVKGLKNHEKGETLKVILKTLSELGYSYRYEVLNAKNFGVPQNRERLFIIAWYNKTIHIKDFNFPYGLRPDGTHIYDPQKVQEEKIKTKLSDIFEPESITDRYAISDVALRGHQRRKKRSEKKGNGFGYSLWDRDSEYCSTLLARYYKDAKEILIYQADKGKNPRKLTPVEAGRLQGYFIEGNGWMNKKSKDRYKDNMEFKIAVSNTESYKQFGNSVAIPVIKAISKEIYHQILKK